MYLYKKLKRFSPFSALLLKSKSNFERFFFLKMTLIHSVFLKLLTAKYVAR